MDEPRFQLTQRRRGRVAARAARASRSISSITDPPYESLEKHRAIGTTTRLKHSKASSNDWFAIFPNARFPELFAEVYRVLSKNAHFYLFCDPETMFVAKPLAEEAGFKFWKPLVWDKIAIGMGYHYRARYECILFFEKGKRKLNDLGIADIIEAPARSTAAIRRRSRPRSARCWSRQSTRAGRARGRSVHGLGLGRRRGGAQRARLPRQRSVRRGGRDRARAVREARRARARCELARRRTTRPQLGLALRARRVSGAMTGHQYRDLIASVRPSRATARTGWSSIARSRSARRSSARTARSTCSSSGPTIGRRSRSSASTRTRRARPTRRSRTRSQDLEALWVPGCLAYAGKGWSRGVLHTLEGSRSRRTACRTRRRWRAAGRRASSTT